MSRGVRHLHTLCNLIGAESERLENVIDMQHLEKDLKFLNLTDMMEDPKPGTLGNDGPTYAFASGRGPMACPNRYDW